MEPEALEEPKQSEIQRIVMDYLDRIINSSRDFKKETGISHAMFGRYKDMKSMMSVAKLEHIVSKYPDLKLEIIRYLRGNTDENITHEPKKAGSSDNNVLLNNALAAILKKDDRIIELEAKLKKATGSGKARPAKGTK